MQVEAKKKVLPGGLKLVAVVSLFVIGAVVALMQMTAEGSAKAKALTATGDSFVLVHLDTAKNFSEANAFCASEYSAHLAVIEDSDANQRFKEALAHYSTPAWIGFADISNSDDFNWVDASPKAYVNWDAGEPTDLCVQMLAATGTWQDVDCAETNNAFFCEVPAANDDFEIITTAKTWDDANAYCEAEFGTSLATIHNEVEQQFLAAEAKALSLPQLYHGYNDKALEGTWVWADASDSTYTSWGPGEPNNGAAHNCAYLWNLWGDEYLWNDDTCMQVLPFVCKVSAPTLLATIIVRVDNAEVHKLPTAIGSGEAQAYCQSQGFDLYSVIDTEDNTRIQTALNAAGVDSAWIGLQTAAASYAWKDGRALDYVNWATADGEPKESHFSQMRASDGQWMTACADDKHVGVVCAA